MSRSVYHFTVKIDAMIYAIGTIGFICGFFLGQVLLLHFLRNVPKEELIENKSLHWKYGMLNWAVAILTAALFGFTIYILVKFKILRRSTCQLYI